MHTEHTACLLLLPWDLVGQNHDYAESFTGWRELFKQVPFLEHAR